MVAFVKNYPFEIRLLLLSLHYKTFFKIFQIILIILNVSGFIVCIIGRLALYHKSEYFKNEMVIFISCFSDFLLVFVSIMGVVGFIRSAFIVKLFTFLSKRKFTPKESNSSHSRIICAMRLAPLAPILVEGFFLQDRVGWHLHQYFVPRSIWLYCLNLMVCTCAQLVDKINIHFIGMNDYLEELGRDCPFAHQRVFYIPKFYTRKNRISPELSCSIRDLLTLSRHYTVLCNLIDRFNCFIKAFLAIMLITAIVNILYNCTVLISFGTKPKSGNTLLYSNIFVFAIQSMSALSTVGQIAVSSLIGEKLQGQGERTASLCYTFLNKINNSKQYPCDQLVVQEITFLLDQSKTRKLCLHAGGFFQVNWGLLGAVTSTVSTYCIVIMQFVSK
ncbi:uncharacterized protein LOC109537322 [Dendroctonus ponderosae]|uniref:Gustatory receptor n=1 Tax=Dendroctonus ponderosae TaxID=77166 RepID=A0AAR5PFL2_DENPD|nr:uncharacterized protein LOC109537322 [Dendroctonus ponderosae]